MHKGCTYVKIMILATIFVAQIFQMLTCVTTLYVATGTFTRHPNIFFLCWKRPRCSNRAVTHWLVMYLLLAICQLDTVVLKIVQNQICS